MRGCLRTAALALASVAVVAAASVWYLTRHSYPPEPELRGALEHGALEHGGRSRTWIAYVPKTLAKPTALVLVLHSSMGTAEKARQAYGYDFDALADRHGFLAVYPQGYEGHWNDCKAKGPYAAKRAHVDDVGFLRALVDRLAEQHGVDRTRVYVTGVSNGGSMTLCLALTTPEFARAYAAVAASVPTPENLAITPDGGPASVLLMNGTEDPINPWAGGDVVLWPVLANRGPVLSAEASIDVFRRLDGLEAAPLVTTFPDADPGDGSTVERALWASPGKHRVALYTIRGGGHGVPHPAMHGWRLLGNSNRDIHGADEIWKFFESEP